MAVEAGSVVVRFIGDDKSMQAATKRFMADMDKIIKRTALVAAAVATASAKMAADFDKGIREISTLIKDVTDKDIKMMGDEIKKLGVESGQNLKSLSKSLYDITSAGFVKAADSALVLNAATKLAVGGVTEVSTSTDVLTSALNSYQLQAKDAIMVSDILFTTVRLGKTTMDELGASLGQLLPFAKGSNLALSAMGAGMATLTAGGLQTAIATTAFKNALVSITAPTESAAEAMREAGKEAKYFADGTLDLLSTIEQFRGLSLAEIMKFVPEKRAATAILSLSQNYEKLRQNLVEFQDTAGATEEANAKMQQSFAVQFAKIKNIVQTTMISLGEEIIPAILPAIQEVGEYLVTHAGNISEFFKRVGDTIAAMTTNFNTFVMNVSGIVFAINLIKFALMKLNVVANANPIGILVTTVAAGVPFLISLFKKLSDGVDVNMDNIISRMKEAGAEQEKLNELMQANALLKAKENVDAYTNSFNKLSNQIKRRYNAGQQFEELNAIMTDGVIDIDKVSESLTELQNQYIELVNNIPEKKEGIFADNTQRNIMLGQIEAIEWMIDKYTALIEASEKLKQEQSKLNDLTLKATLKTEVSGINVNQITPTIEQAVEDWNNILREDLFADFEFPDFEIPELEVDEFYDEDAAESQAQAVVRTAEWITKQQAVEAEKQKRIYQSIGDTVKSVANQMGNAFAQFSNNILEDNMTVEESFKDVWKTIVNNFITSIATMIGELLVLFATYTLLNLLTDGNLGRVIKGISEGGKFFQGLGNFITGSGEEQGKWIQEAFKSIDWGNVFGGLFGGAQTAGDGIITPSGNLIRTDPNDFLYAAKNPSVIPAMAGATGGGQNIVVNLNIQAMDGTDVYRTLTNNAGKVKAAITNITGRHF